MYRNCSALVSLAFVLHPTVQDVCLGPDQALTSTLIDMHTYHMPVSN